MKRRNMVTIRQDSNPNDSFFARVNDVVIVTRLDVSAERQQKDLCFRSY